MTAAEIYETLGGRTVFQVEKVGMKELGEQVRKGLPYGSLDAVMERFDLSRETMAEALHLSLRTLARRKRQLRLHLDESDRVFRLARIAAQATDVLGSTEKAARWLKRPNRTLGGREPLRLLDTDAGVCEVEGALGRIEHGIYG